MELQQRVREFIAAESLLRPEERVVVAVSGGPDSLCLLHVLHDLGEYELIVAHLDHGLRPESRAEAEFVRATAAELELPAKLAEADLSSLLQSGHGEEEAGRIARYRFLVRVAEAHGAGSIVTGHTASDQVETILMHLLRGAGPHGLQGMRPRLDLSEWGFLDAQRPIWLARPLLKVTRQETQAYCRARGLSPLTDPSNLQREYLRNRIRLELIPRLERYQPALERVLLRTGRLMRATSELLSSETQEARQRCVRRAGEAAVAIQRAPFAELPKILQWELLRDVMADMIEGQTELDFETVERGATLAAAGLGGRHSLVADLELEQAGTEIIMRRAGARVMFPQRPQIEAACPLPIPGSAALACGWQLRAEHQRLRAEERREILRGGPAWRGARLEALDAVSLPSELTLRPPEPGDRFQPLGMEGSMSLADFFINEGVPRLQRERWPLLTSGDQVLWAVGLRIGERYRVKADSEKILRLELVPPGDEAPKRPGSQPAS